MDLIALFQELSTFGQTGLIGVAIILVGMIKIPKLELNIWNWLGRTIGRSINKEAMDQVDEFSKNIKKQVDDLYKEVDTLRKDEELERVRNARQRILRFNDEILFEKRHSKEHFDEILDDITLYEQYCKEHKDYENNKAVLAIATVKRVYDECMQTHDFLTLNKKEK